MLRSSACMLLFLVTLWCSPVLAQPMIVLTEEWAPFNYTADGTVVGMSTELVEEVFKRSGVEYDLRVYPWKRAYNYTLNSENSALFTTSRTPQREKLFKWVGPLYPRQIILYKLRGRKDIEVTDLASLKKFKTGVLLGGSVEEFLRKQGFEVNKHYETVPKEAQNIPKLFARRIDLIPGSEVSMAYRMKDLPYNFDELEKAFVLIDQGGYYLALNVNTPDDVLHLLQSNLDALIDEGVRKEITKKYLGYAFGE